MRADNNTNNLLPVFLKLERFRVLVVGGGPVALEKVNAIVKNSPATKIKLVAPQIVNELRQLATTHSTVTLIQRKFRWWDLFRTDLVMVATSDRATNSRIRNMAKWKGLLVNVADTPDLCDFYMGSIVTKGSVKIGISTNGKSPTMAKRIRESLDDTLPDDTEQLLDNLSEIRSKLKGGFATKVRTLNEITTDWLRKANE